MSRLNDQINPDEKWCNMLICANFQRQHVQTFRDRIFMVAWTKYNHIPGAEFAESRVRSPQWGAGAEPRSKGPRFFGKVGLLEDIIFFVLKQLKISGFYRVFI